MCGDDGLDELAIGAGVSGAPLCGTECIAVVADPVFQLRNPGV